MTIPFLLLLTSSAWATLLDVRITDMDCQGCEAKISKALDNLPFLDSTNVSYDAGQACAEINGAVVDSAVSSVLQNLGYTVTSIKSTEHCDLSKTALPKNWAEFGELDVQIISTGANVTLDEHRSPDKFTIYDFGAPWCGPCHVAEKLLKQYLADHTDTAVRAIVLNSQDAKASFNMPAAIQHLSGAPGLPYFIVVNPKGKVIHRGVDLPKVLKQIDKRR